MLTNPNKTPSGALLCVGDIHLGRRPSRLPEGIGDWLRPEELAPSAAWAAAVEAAIARRVDALLLAGDVVDAEDDFFEAYTHLRRGVDRLLEAGIRVLGVAGNHDVRVLPRLAAEIEGFVLLGAGGEWRIEALRDRAGHEIARVLGWSFAEREQRASPLDGLPGGLGGETPLLGLLHCDLGATRSRYAPVARGALADSAPDAWLLGHVHKPDSMQGPRPIGYLGSLVGLDPGETGARGPWLLRLGDGPGGIEMSQLPLAPLRWEIQELRVDDLERSERLEEGVVGALEALHGRLADGLGKTSAVGCRIRVVGECERFLELDAAIAAADPGALLRRFEGVVYFVEGIENRARPARDLAAMARGDDPAALLARRLLLLEADPDDAERAELIRRARAALEAEARAPAWGVLDTAAALDDRALAERLRSAGRRALERLLEQRGSGG